MVCGGTASDSLAAPSGNRLFCSLINRNADSRQNCGSYLNPSNRPYFAWPPSCGTSLCAPVCFWKYAKIFIQHVQKMTEVTPHPFSVIYNDSEIFLIVSQSQYCHCSALWLPYNERRILEDGLWDALTLITVIEPSFMGSEATWLKSFCLNYSSYALYIRHGLIYFSFTWFLTFCSMHSFKLKYV